MNDTLEQTIFGDIANLEKTLIGDLSGERARAMISYFHQVAQESSTMLQNAQVGAERQLISQLVEAFGASQRVIQKVWESLHGSTLAA